MGLMERRSRKAECVLLALVWLAMPISESEAFDGKREGLMLNLGFGVHLMSRKILINGFTSESNTVPGAATHLKLGYGLKNGVLVYYAHDSAWYKRLMNVAGQPRHVSALLGLRGIGASRFLRAPYQRVNVSGALGFGVRDTPTTSTVRTDRGFAVQAGVGYFLQRNVQVELRHYFTWIEDASSPEKDLRHSATTLTMQYVWF